MKRRRSKSSRAFWLLLLLGLAIAIALGKCQPLSAQSSVTREESVPVVPVPEPSTYGACGATLLVLVALLRRRHG